MKGSKILFNSSTIEIEFKFFFFFLRIEIDIFRHETNLTSETWQTFFFHFEDARETSELHQVRGKEIFQQVSVWLKS